jgi:hypothetical protein
MRRFLPPLLTLAVLLGFTAAGNAADRIKLELADEKLPLQELRPLDRRVWILTLEGNWTAAPTPGKNYYVNLLFPNGQSDSHRPLNDSLFRLGEVRVILQDYQLKRHGRANGGTFQVVVSEDRPVASAQDPQVISNALQLNWPMDRPVVQRPPRSRFAPPPPVDAFPPEPTPAPPPKPVPEPAPKPKPEKEPA